MIATPVLVVVVAVALAVAALVLNQVQARLGLIELTLNDGWPPGHAPTNTTTADAVTIDPHHALSPGLHLFLSRGCHACQRLIDELTDAATPAHLATLHYVDRARPTSRSLADAWGTALLEGESDLAASLGADPLPYAIAIGPHGLVARSVAPTRSILADVARNAGLDEQKTAPEAAS